MGSFRPRLREFQLAFLRLGAEKQKGPATLSAEPPWITPGKIEFQGKGNLGPGR